MMLYCFALIFLSQLVCDGVRLVFQSSSLTVDVGTNVTLKCDIANVFGQCSSVRWLLYQQENGLRVYSPGFRTFTRKAQQDTQCTLNIYSASPSVNGTFYCLLLNEGVDYMGNGTALTVVDIINKQKVNTHDSKKDFQGVKEHHCLVPLVILGGISILIILGILVICACHRRAILIHQRNNNASLQHQQSSSEIYYATLKIVPRRQECVAKS